MPLDRPVLIIGTPRCGKTCVARVLAQAEQFAAIEEPITIWEEGPAFRPHDRLTASAATPIVRRRILRSCEALVKRSGKQRYLDNLSHHALRIPFISAVMPHVRLVHVIRDPADTIPEMLFGWTQKDTLRGAIRRRASNVRLLGLPGMAWRFVQNYVRSRVRGVRETWGPVVPGLLEFVAEHRAGEIAAYQWRRMMEIALNDLAVERDLNVLEVRYEELVSNPRAEARRIAEFAEVLYPDPLVEYAAAHFKSGYLHWEPCRVEPSRHDWRAIRAIAGPMSVRLGYARLSD